MHRFTGYLRKLDGTPLEPVRNVLLALVGATAEVMFSISSFGKNHTPHPIANLVSRQVGEPRERWDLTDISSLRIKSRGLMEYLPSRVDAQPQRVRLGGPKGVDAILLKPRGRNAGASVAAVYLHGGGFVLGDAKSVLPEADFIASKAGIDVFVLEYPLAPDAIFPEALDRVVAAILELAEDRSKLVLIGESAGANLAASAALRDSRIRNSVCGLVLIYGWLDLRLNSPSQANFGSGHVLTTAILDWFAEQYTEGDRSLRDNPEVSPLLSPTLDSLPPSLCVVGEFDPLLDDMVNFARAVPNSRVTVVRGMVHGFLQFRTVYRKRRKILALISAFVLARLT